MVNRDVGQHDTCEKNARHPNNVLISTLRLSNTHDDYEVFLVEFEGIDLRDSPEVEDKDLNNLHAFYSGNTTTHSSSLLTVALLMDKL